METKLYVGNLHFSVSEERLKEMFAEAGNVVSVNIIKDRDSGRSKGFAFIEMIIFIYYLKMIKFKKKQ